MREIVFWAILALLVPKIIKQPYWGVMVYSFLNILRPEMFFWGSSAGANSLRFVFIVTLLGAAKKVAEGRKFYLRNNSVGIILWYYIALIVSILLSQYDAPRAYNYANEILVMVILASMINFTVDSPVKVIRLETVLLIATVLLGVWGIQQHFGGNVRLEGLGGNAFGDSNYVAAHFVLFFPLALQKITVGNSLKWKSVGAIYTFVIVLLIVFTQSRGGFLGLSTCLLFIVLRSRQKVKILLSLMIVLILAMPFIGKEYIDRLGTIKGDSETGELEGSANSRLYLWQAGLLVFKDNPVFGTGLLTYPDAKMQYESHFMHLDPEFREYVFRKEFRKVSHNTYIQLLSDGGLFLFLPWAVLVGRNIFANEKIRKRLQGSGANNELLTLLTAIDTGIIGYCVCLFFLDGIFAVFLPLQIVVCEMIRNHLKQ